MVRTVSSLSSEASSRRRRLMASSRHAAFATCRRPGQQLLCEVPVCRQLRSVVVECHTQCATSTPIFPACFRHRVQARCSKRGRRLCNVRFASRQSNSCARFTWSLRHRLTVLSIRSVPGAAAVAGLQAGHSRVQHGHPGAVGPVLPGLLVLLPDHAGATVKRRPVLV